MIFRNLISVRLQFLISVLKKKVKELDWYKNQPAEIQGRVSFKMYEMVPKSCTVKHDLPKEDSNIKEVAKIEIIVPMRAGNFRKIIVKIYSVTDGNEVCIKVEKIYASIIRLLTFFKKTLILIKTLLTHLTHGYIIYHKKAYGLYFQFCQTCQLS